MSQKRIIFLNNCCDDTFGYEPNLVLFLFLFLFLFFFPLFFPQHLLEEDEKIALNAMDELEALIPTM